MAEKQGDEPFADLDERAQRELRARLKDLAALIERSPGGPEVAAQIGGLAALIPGIRSLTITDMCDLGDGPPAPRYEVDIAGATFTRCLHDPPHIRVK